MIPASDDGAQDLALVGAVQAGNAAAIQKLAERLQCVPRILCAQNARLGRPLGEHDLADAVQDTMVIVLKKLGEFSGQGVLESWTYRICCYELMNAVRRRRRQPPVVDPEEQPVFDDATGREWRRLSARDTLDTAMAKIGGAEAEALRLRHYEGLTFEEMAQHCRTSVAAAKMRYYRALSRLEEIVTGQKQREDEQHGRS